jgi:hypothetical protein
MNEQETVGLLGSATFCHSLKIYRAASYVMPGDNIHGSDPSCSEKQLARSGLAAIAPAASRRSQHRFGQDNELAGVGDPASSVGTCFDGNCRGVARLKPEHRLSRNNNRQYNLLINSHGFLKALREDHKIPGEFWKIAGTISAAPPEI